MSGSEYGLVLSFPDQSPSFVHGFEAGDLWQRMRRGDVEEIMATTHHENREVIARMAIVEGWSLQIAPTSIETWDHITLRKIKPTTAKPNPHGLRVVAG